MDATTYPSTYGKNNRPRPSACIADLQPLHQALAIRPEFVAAGSTRVTVLQHKSWSRGDFTARVNDAVFLSTKKEEGDNARMVFMDAAGSNIMLLKQGKKEWKVDELGGGQVLVVEKATSFGSDHKFKIKFGNKTGIGNSTVELRAVGVPEGTMVKYQKGNIAFIKRTVNMLWSSGQKESKFECEVAAGLDLTIAVVMAIVLSEFGGEVQHAAFGSGRHGSAAEGFASGRGGAMFMM